MLKQLTLSAIISCSLLNGCSNPESITGVEDTKTLKVNQQFVQTQTSQISLIGKTEMTLNVGDIYSEPGAIYINANGDIVDVTDIVTDINTLIPNIWYVRYSCNGITVVRKVRVIDAKDTTVYTQWDSSKKWFEYSIGDRVINDGKLWECKAIDYSYIEPSNTNGKFGWILIRQL